MPKESFKKLVKKSVCNFAFEMLKQECKLQSKTKELTYNEFKTQNYLSSMKPKMAKFISQARSQTIDIKTHSKFKYSDTDCRLCGIDEESLEHIVKCLDKSHILDIHESLNNCKNILELETIAHQVDKFIDLVSN